MSSPVTLEATNRIPDLRITPTEALIPHEHHDGQRLEPLAERLAAEGTLKNPPIVAALGDERFVVLDGANRVTALARLGMPYCLVQVVPYRRPFVELQTWHHAITDISFAELENQIARVEGLAVRPEDLTQAQAHLARRRVLSYFVRPEGNVGVLEASAELHSRTELLNKVVSIYLHNGRLHRTNSEDIDELKNLFPGLCALMVFPSYEPAEILELAGRGEKIPPGMTRHIIHGRAMRVNYPLDALGADGGLEEKNARLAEWMRASLANKRVRFYAESTFLFDE